MAETIRCACGATVTRMSNAELPAYRKDRHRQKFGCGNGKWHGSIVTPAHCTSCGEKI